MKNNIISKWAALLLTISGMAAMASSNTLALVVNNGENITESGATYTGSVPLVVNAGGTYHGTNITLTGDDNNRHSASANGGYLALDTGTVTSTSSREGAYVVDVRGASAVIQARNLYIGSDGSNIHQYAVNAEQGGLITIEDSVIRTSGTYARGLFTRDDSGAGTAIRAVNVDIFTSGIGSIGAYSESGVIELQNVTINTTGDLSYGIASWTALVTGTGVKITTSGSGATGLRSVNGGTIALTDSSVTTTGANAPLVALGVSSYLHADNSSSLVLNGGTYLAQNSNFMSVSNIDDYQLSGTVVINNATIGSGGDLLTNTSTSGGAIDLLLNQTDATNAGGVTLDAENIGATNVTVNGGSGIVGDITNSGSGALAVNLNASALTGDVTNQGDGVLVITLDNNSIGTGGYHGGHLIIGSDSAWAFDQNSTTDRIDNHGVIHLGTPGNFITIHSDTISGDGTWLFPVNSDTGAKSTVTGSTDAD
ncbi:MAG: hypothetical protein LBK71_00500, partial [Verrucomicrobiales bacterium]|nr:hypothetical protein [Verrucomicrobiales bacterium]